MVICVATSLTSILPASAQNSDQTDEYKTLLKKIMTLSGSSASSEAIMSQLMASMKNGPFQQDEAYWKDFASKWTRKIEDKVMEVYAPIYQQHMTLDELKKVVAFYESPAGRKLGETATAVATESMPMIQQLSMEMVQEMMPKLQKSMLSLCCLVFYSCGMTEPWKDWEHEGDMSADRLRPSEVKELLCAADGWKMIYQGVTFYFQFDEEGNVASDSDETLLKNEVGTDYSLDFQGEKAVLLTLLNGGMLQYLNENSETTFVITGYSDSQITAVGQTHGKEMILTPVSTAALQQAKERKRLAIIAYNKAQAMDLLKGELNNGVFRRSSSSFLAHYLIICDESNNWKVKISAIDNGVVKHTEYPMIIDTTNDENAVLTLGSNVTVDGISLNKLYYNYLNGEIETDNANVVCDTRKASDIAAWYADGWKTHIVDQDEIHADFKGIFHSGVEFDDRNPRNLIACPWSGMGSYIGFAVTMTADNATGRDRKSVV